MPKGFGVKQEEQLGYVLVLFPKLNAYAARLSIDDGSSEEFIGVTNMLESAQVWKTKKQVKQAILKYADCIEEQMKTSTEVNMIIKLLKRKGDGQLTCEHVETLFMPGEFQ
jgi:hypothetical protein